MKKKRAPRLLLHVGCGGSRMENTTAAFNDSTWREIRLDINPAVQPDVIGTMTDMQLVDSASVDAIYSSHNIEHLYPHEVPVALAEFRRVLKVDGFVVMTCPDLRSVCALIAEDKLVETAYESPAGPIAPLDILYGHRPEMANGNLYMAHRCGFTQKVLAHQLRAAGFLAVVSAQRGHPYYDLWALATMSRLEEPAVRDLALRHFPPASE